MILKKWSPGNKYPEKWSPGKMVPGKLVPGKLRNKTSLDERRASWCVPGNVNNFFKQISSFKHKPLFKIFPFAMIF